MGCLSVVVRGRDVVKKDTKDFIIRLPAAPFEFRADYLGSRYWCGVETLQADVVNKVDIFTGGGAFDLTILKDRENPLAGDKIYLFNPSGSYLGIGDTTDEHGQVSFDLPQGSYQFRIDTLGYRFWTGVYDVPDILADEFTIPHQDVTITVQGLDPDPTPLDGLNVYLFTPKFCLIRTQYVALQQIMPAPLLELHRNGWAVNKI